MDVEEQNINKIAAYHSNRYWQSFVYVELNADKPIGLYDYADRHIEDWLQDHGYYHEEYGLFDNVPITRECYDDGAAEINGKITDTSGAELRVRYLTKYNFIIASRDSPISNQAFENYSEVAMNEILSGKNTVENLVEIVKKLPRHDKDY